MTGSSTRWHAMEDVYEQTDQQTDQQYAKTMRGKMRPLVKQGRCGPRKSSDAASWKSAAANKGDVAYQEVARMGSNAGHWGAGYAKVAQARKGSWKGSWKGDKADMQSEQGWLGEYTGNPMRAALWQSNILAKAPWLADGYTAEDYDDGSTSPTTACSGSFTSSSSSLADLSRLDIQPCFPNQHSGLQAWSYEDPWNDELRQMCLQKMDSPLPPPPPPPFEMPPAEVSTELLLSAILPPPSAPSGGGCLDAVGTNVWQQSGADAGAVPDPELANIFYEIFAGKTASEVQELLKSAQPASYED